MEYRTAVDFCLDVLAGKWKVLILSQLFAGCRRMAEITEKTPGLSKRVLIRELKELEIDGVVQRHEFDELPPRVEFALTDHGRSLEPIIEAMQEWGMAHLGRLQDGSMEIVTAESMEELQQLLSTNPAAQEILQQQPDPNPLRFLVRRGKRLDKNED
ncbi:MAG: winged helix-turn-helix transcriptional regulator [Gammaproteobacteria bacterium]